MNYQELWDKTSIQLAKVYSDDTYQEMFSEVKKVVKFLNGTIYVLVPNLFIKKRINNLYIFKIQEILATLTPDLFRFKFVTAEEIIESPTYNKEVKLRSFESNLNINYSFESFVVGDSNMLSCRMAMKVAEQPVEVANPLYIFGGVGLGKTHLMQAIGNYMYDKDINKRILYIQANTFIYDYTKAAQSGNMSAFDDKYNNLDALLVDDIQMLEMGKKSQQQFFQLFNDMHAKRKQIVITSDCPADQLKGIMDRLTSRFSGGLMVNIKLPDLKHRMNILRRKTIESSEVIFTDDVLEYIAINYTNNIRELEGGFNRVLFYCASLNIDVTLESTKEALADLIKNKNQNGDNDIYENALSIIANYYNIAISDLLSNQRNYKYVLPRHISMYIFKKKYNLPYKKIGILLGGRDHTTVIAGCAKIEQEIKNDSVLKTAIESIMKKID